MDVHDTVIDIIALPLSLVVIRDLEGDGEFAVLPFLLDQVGVLHFVRLVLDALDDGEGILPVDDDVFLGEAGNFQVDDVFLSFDDVDGGHEVIRLGGDEAAGVDGDLGNPHLG